MRYALCCLVLFAVAVFAAVSSHGREAGKPAAFAVTSPAFAHNGNIPAKYTCDGDDINPRLIMENVPPGARSLALVVDDPDAPAGTWVHWVLWNVDPGTKEIVENTVPAGAVQGRNDWQRNSYGGPCPPSGAHRYFFRLYALDAMLNLGRNATREELQKAMKGHVIAHTELVGLYRRR